jgi:hypothetical protein
MRWLGRVPDWINALAAVATLAVAVVAFFVARSADREAARTAKAQRVFEAEIEERQAAPVLAPDVEPELQGKDVKVATSYGKVSKRAERLNFIEADDFVKPHQEKGIPPMIIVPMRNVGDGVAVIPGKPSFPASCPQAPTREPPALETLGTRYLGAYNVPPGESRQLDFAFAAQDGDRRADYVAASGKTEVSLMVVYTDLLGRRLRWTCVNYTRDPGEAWAVDYPFYGDRERKPPGNP